MVGASSASAGTTSSLDDCRVAAYHGDLCGMYFERDGVEKRALKGPRGLDVAQTSFR